MNARSQVVLPGYDSYRGVLSYETAVYQKTNAKTSISKTQETVKESVIEEIVSKSLDPKSTFPLAKELLDKISTNDVDLARDDADDLQDSGDYDE